MSYIPVINFGKQPTHANGFVTKEEFGTEPFYDMVIGFDEETDAIRLMEPAAREVMFNDKYAFYSKTSKKMQKHFADTAEELKDFLGDGEVAVEIGSNDGIMQDAWKALGKQCIGVEPSGNVAEIAKNAGHTVIDGFIGRDVANKLLSEYKVGVVYGANVSCHITDLDEYFDSVARLIGSHGVFVFEDPYFLDVYEKCSYDQFYGEHTWMFTVKFLERKLAEHGMEIFDLKPLWTHGGSMRFYVQALWGKHKVNKRVAEQKEKEGDILFKLNDLSKRIQTSKEGLLNILELVKDKRVCGFGATSKGVVVTNYCGIGPETLPFITDTTPTKIGKFYPGSHIQIVSQNETDYSQFDYIVNFAWNHFDEIKEARKDFKGKWITHVPYPRIT